MRARTAVLAFAVLIATVAVCGQDTMVSAATTQRDPQIVRAARVAGPERMETLMAHGIGPETEGLLRLLTEGLPQAAVSRGLPQDPRIKTEVVNAAIQELGFRQAAEAVPVLIDILNNEMPRGVLAVLDRDMERMPLENRDLSAAVFLRFVRYNAIVAAGLIGDPATGSAIRDTIDRETQPSFIVEGAVALGLVGSPDGVRYLAEYITREDADLLREAFAAIYFLTGRNYDISENTSLPRQREAIRQFQEWAAVNAGSFEPARRSILRRREEGVIRTELPVTSLRGALQAVRQFRDYDRRWSARQYLSQRGPSLATELKTIAEDPLEDIDIRASAMEWYAAAAPRDARKVMKRIERNTESETLRAQAKRLRRDIDSID